MKKIISVFCIICLIVSSVCIVGCENNSKTTKINDSTPYYTDNYYSEIVYVSNSGKIHNVRNCSGMKYYTIMDYDSAIDKGYVKCKNCY